MPWDAKDAVKHNKEATGKKGAHWAQMANAIRDHLIASGKPESDADASAIRIANAHLVECANVDECTGLTPTSMGGEDALSSTAFETINSAVISQKKKVTSESISESAGTIGTKSVKFNDDKLTIENAAIFGPPLDKSTGHYVSDKGRHYAASFHKSVMEQANTGALGWPAHPDPTPAGGYRMRPSDTFTHSIIPGTAWIDESAGKPTVRAHIQFEDEAAYKRAKRGKNKLGFSIFAANANSTHDFRTGKEVFESIDTDEKRPMSVDLVEASGATGNIIESAAEQPKHQIQESTTMPEKLEINVAEITEQVRKSVMESVQPKLDEGKKAIDEAAAYRKVQLVNSCIEVKKLDGKFVTPTLRKALLECADETAINAAIDEHKTMLAANINPVTESGGEGQAVYVVKKSIAEDVSDMGFTAVLEQCAGSGSVRQRDIQVRDKIGKIGLGKIANMRDQSEGTNKLRKAISEQANSDPKFFKKIAHSFGITEDGLESREQLRSILETTGTPVDSTGYTTINSAVCSSEMILGYNIVGGPNEGIIGKSITKTYPSRIYPEVYPGFTAAGGIATTAEGAAANDATMLAKTVSDPAARPSKYTVFASVTREEVLLDKTLQVMERLNRCGMDARIEEEKQILTGVFDLNSKQSFIPYITNAYTATSQFTNTDGNNAITLNKISNTLVDFKNFWLAQQTLRAITDENSRPIVDNAMMPAEMVVGSTNRELALAIINAREYRKATVGGEDLTIVDAANFGFSGTSLFYSIILEGITGFTAGDWYLSGRGGFQKQYLRKELIPFEVVQVPQAEIQGTIKDLVAGVKAEFWMWIVARDQRYVLRNTK